MTATRFNFTRTSRSIPKRLLRERKPHFLPIYYLLRLSELGREGIENSGSFIFADHIYESRPKGRFGIGRILDSVLLSLPSARSFRSRFFHVKSQLRELASHLPDPVILSVPSGVPRDLIEVAAEGTKARFVCLDLDRAPLEVGETLARLRGVESSFTFVEGDAFDRERWPRELDAVSSTGLAEFLPDEKLIELYSIAHEKLVPGGLLVTSSTLRHRFSAFLMEQIAELRAHYRDEEAIETILRATPFREWKIVRDPIGYQLLITARKHV